MQKIYNILYVIARSQREDGFWYVSLASPETYGGKETTGTSLFLHGMSWGIRNGILKYIM